LKIIKIKNVSFINEHDFLIYLRLIKIIMMVKLIINLGYIK